MRIPDSRLVMLAVICGCLSGLFIGIWIGMSVELAAVRDRGHEVRR